MKKFLNSWPLHTLLFSLYVSLAFLAWNIEEMRVEEIVRPFIISLLLGSVILMGFRVILKDLTKAGLATSIVLIILLSYGQLYGGLKELGISGPVVRHRYLLLGLVFAGAIMVFGIYRLGSTTTWTRGANIAAIIVVIGPIVGLFGHSVQSFGSTLQNSEDCELSLPGEKAPDVYLIVLDAYERADVLKSLYGFDNEPFLEELRRLGFYIAEGSMSNYRHTTTSLAATLNLQYIQNFPSSFGTRPNNSWDVVQKISDNRLRSSFECLGYRIVASQTGFKWTEWTDADYYIAETPGGFELTKLIGPLAASERVFLGTTVVRAITDGMRSVEDSSRLEALDPLAIHRQQVLFSLGQLPQVARLPSPKFVFVHIVSPHPPFVFGRQGEFISVSKREAPGADLKALYADQVFYLNGRALVAIKSILAESAIPPIIVLMGDHGYAESNSEEKMSILNAYHLPRGVDDNLYPTISPVNSFRIVLEEYFRGTFGVIPDVSFISDASYNFEYDVVPNTWNER